jgi:hypothetical protein
VDRLAVLGSLVALSACGGGESSAEPASLSPTVPDSRPSPTTSATTSDPEDEAAAQAAMAVYRDLTELVQNARRDPSQDWLPAYTQLTPTPTARPNCWRSLPFGIGASRTPAR